MDVTLAVLGALVVLALIDSTSVGTLVVPIWLMLSPRGISIGRMTAYLVTVATFYLGVGLLLLAGVDLVSDLAGGLADQRWLRWVQLVVGATMLLWGVSGRDLPGGSGRLRAWRDRVAADGSIGGLMRLALLVTTVEVAMMLPYLAAIGTVSSIDTAWPVRVALLAGYCVVMVLPAVVLLTVRVVGRERLDPLLRRVDDWITRNAAETTGWIVGIVGFYLAGNAYQALF